MVAVTPRSGRGILRGFVPPTRAIAQGRAASRGTALFCDVRGFTHRTDSHVDAHGRRLGAEVLHGELERTMDGAIQTAAAHGGAPVAFAGDAVTFWFDGEANAARAAACALALADSSGDALGLRVSVATGELERLDVGSAEEGRMQLVGGAAVARLAMLDASEHDGGAALVCTRTLSALEACRPRAEAAGLDAWRLRALDEPPRSTTEPGGHAIPAGVESIEWVPAPLRSMVLGLDAQVRAGTSPDASDLAGLRPLVPLFVHFGGTMTSRPDEIRALVDRVQHQVHSRGGTVLSTNSDAKGSYIAAIFGAPTAHEDDVERAIDAAAALTSGLAGDRIRVGLARGSALVGLMGLGTRPRYDAIGATMNRAARLMMRAGPGEALLAAELCEAQAGRYALHPLAGPDEGAARRLGVRVRRSTPARDEQEHQLLERAEALERLRAAMGEADSGSVVIEGPPGFGKSTLLDAARREAEATGMLWLQAAGDELARDRALHAMQAIFDALLGHAAGTSARPVIAWATGQSHDMPDALRGLGGSERAAALAASLSGLISEIAQRQPVVIALDDGQWIDSVTWTMLLRLKLATPVKLVVARRPGAAATREGAALLDGPAAVRIPVGPLSESAVMRLAALELGAETLAYDLGRLIVENAGGSPLFTQEIARVLNGRDLLRRDGGHISAATGAERLTRLDFVESLEAAILARFDTLPRSRKQVARAASVVGATFSLDALQVAMGEARERRALEDDVNALRSAGYFVRALDGQPGAFGFRHALVREAISGSMTFAARARVSERLAAWWASRGAAPEAMHRRARYLLEAVRGGEAQPKKLRAAIAALQAAARQATCDYANLEASWLLEDALDLVRRLPDGDESSRLRLEVQSTLAFCLATFRGYGDPTVEDAYRKSLALTADAQASEGLAFTLYGLFSFFSSRGDYPDALRLARRLQRLARRFDDLRLTSVEHQARAIVAVLRGRATTGARLAAASIADADRMGDQVFSQGGAGDFRIFSAAWLALAMAVRGDADAARAAHARALEQASGEAFAAGFVRTFCPLPVLEGDAEAARDYAAALVADADARGFALFSIIGRIYLGWAQTCLTPDAPEARAMLAQHLQIAQAMKLDSFTPLFLALAGEAHHAAGDNAAAAVALDAGTAVVSRTGGRLFAPELLRVAAGLPGADSAALLARAAAQSRMQGSELFARKAEREMSPELRAVPVSGAAH